MFSGALGGAVVKNISASRIGVTAFRSPNPLSPVLEFDAHWNEIFYRTMSPQDYEIFKSEGRVPATGETFISPLRDYAQQYNGVTVRFTVRPGTIDKIMNVGLSADNRISGLFPNLPSSAGVKWVETNARIKFESKVLVEGGPKVSMVNIGLGRGVALDIFDAGMVKYEAIFSKKKE